MVQRVDGVKMFALAALAAATCAASRHGSLLRRWKAVTGWALAVTITASGIGYLLLSTALTPTAFVSLPLLLVWIAALGAALGRLPELQHRTAGRRHLIDHPRPARPQETLTSRQTPPWSPPQAQSPREVPRMPPHPFLTDFTAGQAGCGDIAAQMSRKISICAPTELRRSASSS
ncbi:hypothetical protein WJ438_10155 [Streptomyces sp. GD-15H]|uniref:hypothetical protein n=1 Tax=Streptomyces sp. GD-15H TaxID=3129112 RepID=UPI00324AA250